MVHPIRGPRDPWHARWRAALEDHHYLGAGPLCGEQLRYVVCQGEAVVAAVAFSSAARHVAARDEYIGWSAIARRCNRALVLTQSRFCLTVRAKNLASYVQALLAKRVAKDWQEVYGRCPVLLETFVAARFTGASYRAANWQLVGKTAGRGRQDRHRSAEAGVKTVWVFPLCPTWRETLRREPVRKIDPDLDWAETEWGNVDLGDLRLTWRLIQYGRSRFERPTANLPQSCGSSAATKAAYRLLNHPLAELDTLLSAHHEATLARAANESVVLAIQDTTSFNYTAHPATEDLGPITSTGPDGSLGMLVHSTLLTSSTGVPLGLLNIQAWVRDPEKYGQKATRHERPTEEKESRKWLRGYDAADAAAKRLDKTKVVVVADREADMFDLFAHAAAGSAQLLVRALHPRKLLSHDGQAKEYVWDRVGKEPLATTMDVRVPRSGSRPGRVAHLEVRFHNGLVRGPHDGGRKKGAAMCAIAARETPESAGAQEPIEWLLLTTVPVNSAADAVQMVKWYAIRWTIEVFHRTLKTGCGMERRQLGGAHSLQAALAVDAVVAWRVMYLVKLGRETPETPCTVILEDLEWKALCCFVSRTRTPPTIAPTLREAVRMIAGLGGFLGRKGDGEPGTETVWRGLEELATITSAFEIFLR